MPAHATPDLLIVDDDPAVARSMARLLRREGFGVKVAASCEHARTMPDRFDVALVDLDLGDGSGLVLGSELLEHQTARRVCFFSGTNDPELERRAREVGIFVRKGLPGQELVLLLAEEAMKARAANGSG